MPGVGAPAGHTADELAAMFGLHPGTIRNYATQGVIPRPAGSGKYAVYGPRAVVEIADMIRRREDQRRFSKKSRAERNSVEFGVA